MTVVFDEEEKQVEKGKYLLRREFAGKMLIAATAMVFPATPLCSGDVTTETQTLGVDNSVLGHFRALSALCLQAFENGDTALAGRLAHILERSWDHGESKKWTPYDKEFKETDKAMDRFIGPIQSYALGRSSIPPDAASVRTAFNDYMDLLKKYDTWFNEAGNFRAGEKWPHP